MSPFPRPDARNPERLAARLLPRVRSPPWTGGLIRAQPTSGWKVRSLHPSGRGRCPKIKNFLPWRRMFLCLFSVCPPHKTTPEYTTWRTLLNPQIFFPGICSGLSPRVGGVRPVRSPCPCAPPTLAHHPGGGTQPNPSGLPLHFPEHGGGGSSQCSAMPTEVAGRPAAGGPRGHSRLDVTAGGACTAAPKPGDGPCGPRRAAWC